MAKLVIRFEPFQNAVVAQLLEKDDPFMVATKHIGIGTKFILSRDSIFLSNTIGDICAYSFSSNIKPEDLIEQWVEWITDEAFPNRTPNLGEIALFSDDKENWTQGWYCGKLSDKVSVRSKFLCSYNIADKNYKAFSHMRPKYCQCRKENNVYTWEQE